ncbi:hypothetical protein BDW59DRAFT_57240 [Aspergillus cavernicola]|uniref:SAM domain-containing protein n=1 Tax=Aspergillus cavernicola TaxID=176166 RepID=A0ABR4II38_9EURO
MAILSTLDAISLEKISLCSLMMSSRTIYLITSRVSSRQRAHFAVFVPSATDLQTGSLINVVGAPMIGFAHEFKPGYSPSHSTEPYEIYPIGQVDSSHIVDWPDGMCRRDTSPAGDIEVTAFQVPAPRISQDFMAPVNDTTKRRCQEWTMDYIRHLVAKGYIELNQFSLSNPSAILLATELDYSPYGLKRLDIVPNQGCMRRVGSLINTKYFRLSLRQPPTINGTIYTRISRNKSRNGQ